MGNDGKGERGRGGGEGGMMGRGEGEGWGEGGMMGKGEGWGEGE